MPLLKRGIVTHTGANTPETLYIQKRLPYGILKWLPWNHFGRKNLGYLFAIHHGAQVIYDTDDDNELLMDVLGNPEARLPHLTFSKTGRFFRSPSNAGSNQTAAAFNPYPMFGARQAWPRGLPLEEIRLSSAMACNLSAAPLLDYDIVEEGLIVDVGVIQSLADHDPDVDAIYRLSPLPLPFTFSPDVDGGLPVALGHEDRLMSPYNAQATLHMRSALWAMLLPISVHGRVSDIWRSYFAQRLFWETGTTVAFAAPWVVQMRNPHDYLADFEAESDLYGRSGELIRYLTQEWNCSEDAGIDACMMALYLGMYKTGIVEHADVQLAAAWLADIKAIGYDFPERVPGFRDAESAGPDKRPEYLINAIDIPEFSVAERPPQTRRVARLTFPWSSDGMPSTLTCRKAWASIYADADFKRPRGMEAVNISIIGSNTVVTEIQITHGLQTDDPLFVNLHCLTDTLDNIGPVITFRLLHPVAILPVFEDVLLIVNFNHGQDYHLVPDLLSSYGQAFPNHMFIGSDQPNPALDKSIADQIHVLPEVKNGWHMPVAMQRAMEVHPSVKGGYLLVNNDVAMRFWKWHHRDWAKIGGSKVICMHNLSLPHEDPAWQRWNYRDEVAQGTATKILARFNDSDSANLWAPCGDRILYAMWSDAVYVPSRFRMRYLELLHALGNTNMGHLFEAVTPMLLSMMEPVQEWASFNMLYCWGSDWAGPVTRTQCPQAFLQDPQLSMVHTWKVGTETERTPFASLPQQKLWYRM